MANETEAVQGEQNVATGTETVETTEAEVATLTQAQFDAALQARLNDVQAQSAEQLRQMRENSEATIRGYQQAVTALQNQRTAPQDVDDPAPPNMTEDQKLMWAASKPQRDYMKAQLKAIQQTFSQTVNPILQDTTSRQFFASRPNVPETVKQQALVYAAEAANDPNVPLKPEQIMTASYIRALADYAESQFTNVAAPRVASQAVVKPQPRVIAPNGSTDIGGAGRTIGIGRSSKATTWQEDRDFLIAANKFPEDML